MAKSWLVDGRTIARKVKTSTLPLAHQIKDGGATRECPRCHVSIDNSDISIEWPGLPVGVKFEPSDVEILGHLAAKCGMGNETPHQFIDEFIPTLDMDNGICYKHPENLPGATKDGNSVHFFYRTSNAYNTGQRKRRKICKESDLTKDGVRWHKTGKTKAIMHNGVQIGCKKILVLYGTASGGSKPHKLNWVMHQYHLGMVEEETDGQYVVAKISYQQNKETEKVDDNHGVNDELDSWLRLTSPKTPKTDAPDPPRPVKSVSCDDVTTNYVPHSLVQEPGWCVEQNNLPSNAECNNNTELPTWEDDSQTVDLAAYDDSLFCNENLDSYDLFGNSKLNHDSNVITNDAPGTSRGASCADLDNLDLGTPPDFSLSDLQFTSQDSIFGWLERL